MKQTCAICRCWQPPRDGEGRGVEQKGETPASPEVVCLCGSTRFKDAFETAMREETLAGRIVLTVGMFGHAEGIDMNGPVKDSLDQLHFRKIDKADRVHVLNVGGYIGHSTRGKESDSCRISLT